MVAGSQDERCHSITLGLLAKRGWQLVQDEKAFAAAICAEVESRASERAEEQRIAIERATIRHYCGILYTTCNDQGSRRQRRAFEELWQYLYPIALYKTRDANLAQDVAQQSLVKVWRKISQCREPGSFLNWATLILINEIREYYRRKDHREEVHSGSDRDELVTTESDMKHSDDAEDQSKLDRPAEVFNDPGLKLIVTDETERELLAIIKQCVSNTQQQRILVESFFNDKGYKEIAEELGLTVGNVHVLRHRALNALRKCSAFIRFVEDELQR